MSKKTIEPYLLLNAQSLVASFNSSATTLKYMDRLSYFLSWSGSAVGSIIVQGSVDGTTFADLDMNAITMANATDTGIFDVTVTGIPFLRLAYTSTSGTGSLTVYLAAKES